MKNLLLAAVVTLSTMAASVPSFADSVQLYLEINGKKVLGGSSKEKSDGSIECLAFGTSVSNGGYGSATGGGGSMTQPAFAPLTCVKNFDQSSPFLVEAVIRGEPVNGEFRFYRTDESSKYGATEEHYYTMKFHYGIISTVSTNASNGVPTENVEIQFGEISYQDVESGNLAQGMNSKY